MIEVDDNSFKEALKNKNLVLVDFYATWCGPCQMQSEVLSKLSSSRGLTYDIIKVNIDESPRLAMEYGIESIPTLMVFKKCEAVKKSVGFLEEKEIVSMMENYTE